MYERFTEEACRVIMLAEEEARRLGRTWIGTEHILLALIGQGSGTTTEVLNQLGVNLTETRIEVEKITGFSPGVTIDEIFEFTPKVMRVLELSAKEALQLGCNFISTEHLLLALIQEKESVAVRVLKSLGIELSQVRDQVLHKVKG
ncbi:hypothetical protein NIES1031_11770 [Chroogloeocystis siderophila 5.2 s.c.1]|jgi:ATP-dependent Clp protease ATP-binding subunit ClpC|uniref:Clp R domain-containing protein n=1 Tax=Chroogloeocystis siderophila 5.2 s.c.1 TaxID=247279 RepID=A0A1U7HS96_9CHRO|nr:hypothetical protein NIES1031_11770 [Chroogloeocystis siderophila 5.2 s.c.1]